MNDQKNLLLAIVASLLILLIFQYFFPNKPEVKTQINNNIIENSENTIQNKIFDREDVVADDNRVFISKESRLKGSISLRGARFDDVILKDYNDSLSEKSELVTIFSPRETSSPYFAEFGWVAKNNNVDVPISDTLWKIKNGKELDVNNPITLEWVSPDGFIFTRTISVDENYMFSIEQKVKNNSKKTQSFIPYGRINRSGTPKTSGFYILHEGPIAVLNERLIEIDYDDLLDEKSTRNISNGGWLGITDKYWLAAIIPDQKSTIEAGFKATANNGVRYQAEYNSSSLEVKPNQEVAIKSNLFVGAKEVDLLDYYSESLSLSMFDRAVDFGWFYIITKPLFQILHWFSGIFGNVGLSILALTVLIRIGLFPLANKSFKSMSRMKVLTPKIQEIRERYKNDKLKMQQEIMLMYRNEKVNPLSGCLPILIQIPIFFALYKVLFVTLETRHAPFFGWIKDLSAPDPTTIFNLFGLLSFTPPSFLLIGVWPILMALTMFLQTKLNPSPPDPLQAKIMTYLPVVFLFLFATFPAGLVIYWTWNNVLSIGQQWVIMKRTS